jgi:hypothetical protein
VIISRNAVPRRLMVAAPRRSSERRFIPPQRNMALP